MTKPTTDAELAEIRNILDRSTEFNGSIRGRHMTQFEDVPLGSIDIDDVRALVARLDAAEDLLREVARESDVCVFEVGKWMSTEIKIATLEKCRSYLR